MTGKSWATSIVGVFWGTFTRKEPKTNMQNIMELLQLYTQGKIRPRVSEVHPFEDYVKALNGLSERRATGKIVLKVAD
ncbi:zinc-binding dehydrogenase [Vreelandella utahensis]|uniref:zinc-binding dehydrogenase n=1 Tax=Vreelandella halophila TaxID=86177 RepID=UPI001FE945BA|nr:zinc-binding dehydrogenase [Halomonas utahensis]